MDVQELLTPLRHGPVPDVEQVHLRLASRRRRRRVLLVVGCITVAAALGGILWMAPRDDTTVATVADPDPSDDAAGDVRRTVETLFLGGPSLEEKLAQIDDPTGLDVTVAYGMQDDRAHRLTLTIATIDINDPTAVAHIDFFLDGRPAMSDGQLELVHRDDRWLATRDSYCALVATGGVYCPGYSPATVDPRAPDDPALFDDPPINEELPPPPSS